MSEGIRKTQIISGLFWKLMEHGGTQGIQFIVSLILARLLQPDDYGTITLVVIFLNIANVFVQCGLTTSIIQKKNADEVDFSSGFYFSLIIAGLLFFVIFFTAPSIAGFYQKPLLIPVLKVLSFTLFFGAFNSIQNAIIARDIQFKKLFFSSTGSILISGIVGIYMAVSGFGVWALVGQAITNQLTSTLILWFTVKWRPRSIFSIKRVKNLFFYGWKLLASSLIDTLYTNLHSLIIGKMYNPAILGFYNRGNQFPSIIVTNINGSIQAVMLPVLSAEQDNIPRVKDMVRRSIVTSSFIVFPIMVGLAVTAEPLVRFLLTDKWLSCVPFLQIFCASYVLWPIHTSNLQAINALGRSDIFLKLEIIKKFIGLAILAVTVYFGIYAIALGQVLIGIISTFINAYPNKKLLNYSYFEQVKDIMPSLVLSLVMGAVVWCFQLFGFKVWLTLIVQVCVGIVVYLGMARLFNLECYTYLLSTIKKDFNVNKGAYDNH